MLESRLDNTLYRLGFAPTRRGARQLVVHKHIMVNYRCVNIPSYSLKEGDIFHILYTSEESHEIDISVVPICTNVDDELCSDILITPNPINYKESLNITINPELEITRISIDMYDIRGRFINNIFNGNINNILNSSINFDDLLSSGVYILVFNIDGEQKIYKKITYLK